MPCNKTERGFLRAFATLSKQRRLTKESRKVYVKLKKKCHAGGDRKMVKRRRCRSRIVMVGRNRCAKVSCHGNILKGRVKCRRKVAGKARRARVVAKRRHSCVHGHIKGSKKCRKTPKRRVVKSRKRPAQRRTKRRKHSSKVYRKGSYKRCRSCGGRFQN